MLPLRTFAAAALALGAAALLAIPAQAQSASEGQELVDRAHTTFQSMISDPELPALQRYMQGAEAVVIFPNLVRGAFVIGGEGGHGVLLARTADGRWGPPAFYTLASASIGLQIGGQTSETVLVVRSREGLNAILTDEMKLGVDASIAVGLIGQGASGGTGTDMAADIVAYSRTAGLYGGASIDGAWLRPRLALNDAYYGAATGNPADIVQGGRFDNPQSQPLRDLLARHN